MTAYQAKVAIAYSPDVPGESVKSLKLAFEKVDCDVVSADYRQMMRDISPNEFENAYASLSGRQKLFAHAKAQAKILLKDCDCLALPGNIAMIDPNLFNQKRSRHKYDFSRTLIELALVHVATQRGMPIYGVCGGHQVIAVYGGGTLRDLTKQERIHHRDMRYDEVSLHNNTLLHDILFPEGTCFTRLQSVPQNIAELDLPRGFDSYYIQVENVADTLYYIDIKNGSITALAVMGNKQASLLEILSNINPDSRLSKHELEIFASFSKQSVSSKKQVFGAHFQVVEQLAQGFNTTALGHDGQVVEATESQFGAPIITTQFHPEIMAYGFFNRRTTHLGNIEQIKMSQHLFVYLKEAALAFQIKKSMMSELKSIHRPHTVDTDEASYQDSAHPKKNKERGSLLSVLVLIACTVLSVALFIAFPPAALSMLASTMIGAVVGGLVGLIVKSIVKKIEQKTVLKVYSPAHIMSNTAAQLWQNPDNSAEINNPYTIMRQSAPVCEHIAQEEDVMRREICNRANHEDELIAHDPQQAHRYTA